MSLKTPHGVRRAVVGGALAATLFAVRLGLVGVGLVAERLLGGPKLPGKPAADG